MFLVLLFIPAAGLRYFFGWQTPVGTYGIFFGTPGAAALSDAVHEFLEVPKGGVVWVGMGYPA